MILEILAFSVERVVTASFRTICKRVISLVIERESPIDPVTVTGAAGKAPGAGPGPILHLGIMSLIGERFVLGMAIKTTRYLISGVVGVDDWRCAGRPPGIIAVLKTDIVLGIELNTRIVDLCV